MKDWPEFQGWEGCTFPGQPMIRHAPFFEGTFFRGLFRGLCRGLFLRGLFCLRRFVPEPREDLGRTGKRQNCQSYRDQKKRQTARSFWMMGQLTPPGSIKKVQSIRDRPTTGTASRCSSSEWSFEEAEFDNHGRRRSEEEQPNIVFVQALMSSNLESLSAR